MEILDTTYLCLLAISFVLAIIIKKREKGFFLFPVLLGIALLTELLTRFLKSQGFSFIYVYHFYIPVEYCFWAVFFSINNDVSRIKQVIKFSIPVFVLACIFISINLISLLNFPNIQLNIEGLLLVVWATYTIFTIKIRLDTSIFLLPVFWVCSGVLIYYSGISFYMGFYNYIFVSNHELKTILKAYLLLIPNCILYTSLSIAFVCSQMTKK